MPNRRVQRRGAEEQSQQARRLLTMQSELRQADQSLSRAEGQRDAALQRLQDEFGQGSVEEAEAHVAELDEGLNALLVELDGELEDLARDFQEWKDKSV